MANDFDDFSYDPDDPRLNDNGEPEEEDEEGSLIEDLMDTIKSFQDDEDEEDDENDDNDDNSSSQQKKDKNKTEENADKSEKGDGGRYGDKTSPTDKPNIGQKPQTSSPTTPKPSGGDNWFSKFANFGKGGGGAGSAGAKAGGKAAGQVAGKAGGALAKAFAAIGPYGWLAILIILLVIIVIVATIAIVAFFKNKTDPENMSTNSVITSEYFYGTRSVYIDENALTNSLQLSYKQYVIDVVENFEENNPSIDITITLPTIAENEIFTNETQVDQHITNLSLGIANIVATGVSEYSNIDFATLYPQIQYFGLSAEQLELTKTFISDYINENTLYSTQDSGINITNLINQTLTTDADLQYILNLAEKVMIKDEIASESGLENIGIRQYIASIYMPNKDIVIESSSYIISSPDEVFTAKSKLIEENNGTETVHREKETTDNSDIITGFISGKLNVKKFTCIDENNTTAFSAGLSLFDALRLSTEYINYFTLNADGVFTWKPNCDSLYYLTFEAETPFIFTDFDINIKLP